MSDGKRIEGVGVRPDTLMLPSAQDLLLKRDPVLAQAALLFDVKLSPEEAGSLFPVESQRK